MAKGGPDHPLRAGDVVYISQTELREALDRRARAKLGKTAEDVIQAAKRGELVDPERPETSRRVASIARLLGKREEG